MGLAVACLLAAPTVTAVSYETVCHSPLPCMQTHDPLIGCKILTVSVLPPGASVNERCLEPAPEPSDESESSAPTNQTEEDQA